jgi:hypothetical protein
MKLTKLDNNVIIKHFYEWNKSVDVDKKLAIDVYINSIDFLEDDLVFNCTVVEPIIDHNCGITEQSVNRPGDKLGDKLSIKLSEFEHPYKEILQSSIREIKLNKLIEI